MPLRNWVTSHPETIQDFELASQDRLLEGIELLVSGRTAGGVYLLGYVAEMVLKNAVFLFEKARPSDLIKPKLGPIKSFGQQFLPKIQHESYHSLIFWYHVLCRKRADAGRPLSGQLDRELKQRVDRIYDMWIVDMRYYPDDHLLSGQTVYNDVSWIYDNRLRLRN